MWEGELGLGEGPSGSLNEEQSSECLLRVAMLTLNFWLLLIKVEGLEIPDVGSLAWVCVYVCLEFWKVVVFVFGNPQTLILEGGKSGKWAEGEEKSHFLVSLNHINWENI